MKKLNCLIVIFFFCTCIISPAVAGTIGFDDLTPPSIPSGYGGFLWSDDFLILNSGNQSCENGYVTGIISSPNVAFNSWARDVYVYMENDTFDFTGCYLTAAWNNGLNIDVTGYLNEQEIYSQTVTVNTGAPEYFSFDFNGIDKVKFHSYGGTPSGNCPGGGTHFVLDDFIYNETNPTNEQKTVIAPIINFLLSDTEIFDSFNNLDNWVIRDTGTEVGGPQDNIWSDDLVSIDSDNGHVILKSQVVSDERQASQITSIRKFPVTGTFAARIKLEGPSVENIVGPLPTYYHSVKAFFTYTHSSGSWPYCEHVENDFEFVTEHGHPWANPNLYLPQATFTTHMYDDDPDSSTCSETPPAEHPVDPVDLSDDDEEFITLILRVSKQSNSVSSYKLISEYFILRSDGLLYDYNFTETEHGSSVKRVSAMFNNWWLDESPIDYLGDQYLYVDWFYYNSNPDTDPWYAHEKGQKLDQ